MLNYPTLAQIDEAKARLAGSASVPTEHVLPLLDDMRLLIEERSQEGDTDRARFLRRCACAWDCGYARPDVLRLLDRWTDFVLRLEHNMTLWWVKWPVLRGFVRALRQSRPAFDQLNMTRDTIRSEMKRLSKHHSIDGHVLTLANDRDGYGAVEFLAVLTHPCQQCAEDRNAWHTRFAFCNHHREEESR